MFAYKVTVIYKSANEFSSYTADRCSNMHTATPHHTTLLQFGKQAKIYGHQKHAWRALGISPEIPNHLTAIIQVYGV